MGFFDTLAGSSAISGGGSVLGSIISGLFGQSTANKSIKAQRQINQQNIDFAKWATEYNASQQQAINDQNIAFQREINDIMRNDQMHAKSNLVRDLKAAGISTAAGDGQGFTAASLGAPALEASQAVTPHLESEMTPAAVSGLFGTGNSIGSMVSQISSIIADNRKKAAEAHNTEITNSYLDENLTLQNDQLKAGIKDALASVNVRRATADKIIKETNNLDIAANQMKEQLKQLEFDSAHQKERFDMDMSKLSADVSAALALTSNHKAITALTKCKTEYQRIVNDYAKNGVNFENPGSYFEAIIRLIGASDDSIAGKVRSILSAYVSGTMTDVSEIPQFESGYSDESGPIKVPDYLETIEDSQGNTYYFKYGQPISRKEYEDELARISRRH